MLFSSHQLDLVEHLWEDVVILDKVRVVLAGRLTELRAAAPQRRLLPPSAPIFMPLRTSLTDVPAWQVAVAVLLTLLARRTSPATDSRPMSTTRARPGMPP